MAIFRGTGGSGSSSDSTIVDAVTAQATIATTKRDEAEGFRDEAEGFKNTASTAATTATTKASNASDSADTASDKATEANTAKGLAEDAQTAAENARDAALGHANTANSSAVQTVAGSNTQVVGVYNNIANVNTVAGVNTDVTTVAGISSDVTTVAADASDIGTVSTNIANVNNVGNNIANVNAVHGNASNINTVAADGTDIGTVATNIANVNTVAGISSNVTTVAGLESKMDTVIADASDIGAVAGNIGDVTTVAGINSDVDTVAGIAAKVTTVADNITDVQNADTNATNAASSASNASASATSASNSATTATTKATEASNSATAASNSATTATTKASQAAGSATTAGTSASTATTKASEASASATTATTKAGLAASSASAASGSATTAVTKASEASASATSAASSATKSSNAASTWNNFYNSYLGVADAPPSVDVLGNAIVAGALYYDTGAGSNAVGLYVYNGSSWVYSTNYNNVTAPYSLSQDLATNSHDISFGDNAKAQFGASNDLQIYHDGVSRIKEVGANGLYVDVTNDMYIRRGDTSAVMAEFNAGVAKLMFDGSQKLATTSTGIDVTGNITASGNVGIGTTNPHALLHVDGGDVKISSNSGTSNGDGKPTIFFSESGADEVFAQISYHGDDQSGTNNFIGIGCNGSSGTSKALMKENHQMVVTAGGNVGIGTSSPSAPLSVMSETGANVPAAGADSSHLAVGKNEQYGTMIGTLGSGDGYIQQQRFDGNATTYDLLVQPNGGNVGIGTSSPASEVDISKASGGDSALSLTSTGVQRHQIIQKGTGDGSLVFYNQTANAERMRIDSSGRVGIGTSSPSANLDVLVGADQRLLFTTLGTDPFIGAVNGANSAYKPLQLNGSDMKLMTGGSERMRIDSSGNVGIGTTSPQDKLHVNGTLRATDLYVTGGESYLCRTHATTNSSLSTLRLCAISTGDMTDGFGTGITFDAEDNSGTTQAQVAEINAVRAGADNVFNLELQTGDVARLTLGTSGAIFATGTSGTERMRIDASGNVLVGTTSTANNTDGIRLLNAGYISIAQDSNNVPCGFFNKITHDGNILEFQKDGSTVGSISITSSATSYNTSSDERLKENIEDAEDAGSKIDAIQVRQFDWRIDGTHESYGVVAQELAQVAPEAVSGNPESEEMMSVDYSKLVPTLIKEIQTLRNRVAQLENN